jgi:2-iminobutanoate/2-iminopropanoate deaminase
MRTIISSNKVPRSASPVSQATLGGGLLFIGGQMPRDPASGTIPDDPSLQTQLSMQHCIALLEEAGSSLDHVMLVFVYMTDLAFKPIVDRIFAEHFPHHPPARQLIEVSAIGENAIVEFAMMAMAPHPDAA